MSMEPGSVLREPLMKALARFPSIAVEYLISENQSRDPKASRFMAFIINHQSEEGGRIRDALKANIDRMTNLLESSHNQMKTKVDENNPQLAEIQFSCIRLARLLTKREPEWIKDQVNLVTCLRTIWCYDGYHEKHHVDHHHHRVGTFVNRVSWELDSCENLNCL